jgi:acetylornithine/N-succinyldiaminopimelate aminotransferase
MSDTVAANTVTDDLATRWRVSVADTYGQPATVLMRGRGAQVWDDSGRRYLDLLAGIAVNALGHAHPAVVSAVSEQLATLGHTSNLAVTRPAVELAERLLDLLGTSGKVFFSNSGAEANEAAFKLSRLTGRDVVIATTGSFHGRTMGALSITGQPLKRAPFEPLVPGVRFVDYGQSDQLAAVMDESVAAVIVEPIQGEGGVVPAPAGYLQHVAAECASVGALFIVDEVQTGVGRTGRWFAHQQAGVTADVMTLAKGLGGGIPIGATVATGETADLWRPGSHGSTFGGNPVSCAAALAVIATIEAEDLLSRAQVVGDRLRDALSSLPQVSYVRGQGLLLGVVLQPEIDAAAVERAARERGVLLNAIGADVLRLAPPLVLTDAEAQEAVDVISAALAVQELS